MPLDKVAGVAGAAPELLKLSRAKDNGDKIIG
jgi:hypothetical protein